MLGLGILLFFLPSPILNGLAFGLGLYVWYETFGQPGIPRSYQRYFHDARGIDITGAISVRVRARRANRTVQRFV